MDNVLFNHCAALAVCGGSSEILRAAALDLLDRLVTLQRTPPSDPEALHALAGFCATLHCERMAQLLREAEQDLVGNAALHPARTASLGESARQTIGALRRWLELPTP